MKQLFILLCFVLSAVITEAQIVLEHTFDSMNNARMINLSAAGYKYAATRYSYLDHKVNIYNLDHSLYRSIPLPSYPNYSFNNASYISDRLFNNDDSIEFLAFYYCASINFPDFMIVINESGHVLDSIPGHGSIVYKDSAGRYKMFVYNDPNSVSLYGLPGTLPCVPTCGFIVNVNNLQEEGPALSPPVPNPAGDETTINYKLPLSEPMGVIMLYDMQGRLLKKFPVKEREHYIRIKTADFAPGNYYYRLITTGGSSVTYKLAILN
ncbi:MAG: hypothetical protein BGO69_00525 [Bacteroidetes bacterium 46-16]|nr:MAG: hypothetical protein BGO69_00525 [Bacteroidetes bacterium 46-16]